MRETRERYPKEARGENQLTLHCYVVKKKTFLRGKKTEKTTIKIK